MTNMRDVVGLLKKERDRLAGQLRGISAALEAFGATYSSGKGAGRTISAAGKARIAAAQRARWAKLKGKDGQTKSAATPKRRTMSAAARKKIAAAQRARWAKVKASQKKAA